MVLASQKPVQHVPLVRNPQPRATYEKQSIKPLKRPNDKVDETEAITPIIEKAKATVSNSCKMPQSHSSLEKWYPYRKFASEFSLVSKFSKFCIIGTNQRKRVRAILPNCRYLSWCVVVLLLHCSAVLPRGSWARGQGRGEFGQPPCGIEVYVKGPMRGIERLSQKEKTSQVAVAEVPTQLKWETVNFIIFGWSRGHYRSKNSSAAQHSLCKHTATAALRR